MPLADQSLILINPISGAERAVRVAGSATEHQIVVTDVVRSLSNLKGFEDPVRTWEVLW